MKENTFVIDTDKPCPRCGKMGSVNGGLCMECAAKEAERRWKLSDTKTNKLKESLKCILTEEEKLEAGMQLAMANAGVTEKEAEVKKFTSQAKAEIAAYDATISKLSGMIQNGYEYRKVDCEERMFPEEKRIEWIRLDTGEVYKTRPMTPDELQEKLFDGERP